MTLEADTRHVPTQEPLDEEERELMDPETWDWNAVEDGHVVGEPGAIFRVRFTYEESVGLSRVARAAGMNPIAWLHQIALERIAAEKDAHQEAALASGE